MGATGEGGSDLAWGGMPISVPPSPGPSERSANMRGIRRRDTGPEKALRTALHRRGLRFRVDHPIIDGHPRPVRPDIVFARAKVAVFVDGCYWHGCPEHGQRETRRNSSYWTAKIARNRERDSEQEERLQRAGWRVLRFWEHENPSELTDVVAAVLRARTVRRGEGV
jgi:DNA mismatch endonuclease, patch repair protein